MARYANLIPELEQAIRHGSVAKRADMAERLTDLFVGAAEHFNAEQVGLFDEVLGRLADEIEHDTLAGISRRIAPVAAAPIGFVRRLAGDDDIDVAGPVLRSAPHLPDADLAAIAARTGREHLLAISQRAAIAAPVTDILLKRGDGGVVYAVAINRGAALSDFGIGVLVKRSADDDGLAATVGQRPDIGAAHLDRLRETTHMRARAAPAESATAIDYREPRAAIIALARAGKLDDARLRAFADAGQLGETVTALAAMARLPVDQVDRLTGGERLDAFLILGRAIGIDWVTLRMIITLRTGRRSGPSLNEARANFERLSRSSAERVLAFWRNSVTAAAGAAATVTPKA
jgi:uncharacterized protein (DUF2336 family)